MRTRRLTTLAALAAFASALPLMPAAAQVTADLAAEPCEGVCRLADTRLPLRLLPRVASNIYAEKSLDAEIVEADVEAFSPMYVFAREDLALEDGQASGWYAVGPDPRGEPIGWIHAADALEWRQALVAAFSHPGPENADDRRQPVIMFKTLDDLKTVAELENSDEVYAQTLDEIEGGAAPEGVVTIETRRFVDIDEPGNFYILPILQYEEAVRREGDVRYLQLAAATGGSEAVRTNTPAVTAAAAPAAPAEGEEDTPADDDVLREEDVAATPAGGEAEDDVLREEDAAPAGTLRDAGFLTEALKSESEAGPGDLQAADVMFVMDLTSSMQPIVDATLEAVKFMAEELDKQADETVDIRFGIVGYRDNTDTLATLEFAAKNFTPEFIGGAEFAELLDTEVAAAQASSDDFAEEVYAGVALGLDEAPWRENAVRFMVVVGDASPHEPDHPQATTGYTADTLRARMDQERVTTLSLHLLNPRAEKDHPVARAAFTALASNEGAEPAYLTSRFDAAATDPDNVAVQTQKFAERILAGVAKLKGEEAVAAVAAAADRVAPTAVDQGTEDVLDETVGAALVRYVGASANPPADLTFWAQDLDMANPAREALSVRLLISQNELDDLVRALQTIEQALAAQDINFSDFVDELQQIMATALKDQPIDIERTRALGTSGLFPAWLESLPYKSTVLTLTPEAISGLQAGDREEFAGAVKARLELYRSFLSDPDVWVSLNDGDEPGDQVMAIRLADLP